nr:Serine--tRNA ligase [Ipomoea batatas]
MPSFNAVQKQRRAAIADRKRAVHGDPVTGKLKQKPQPLSVSGKRKRKLFKKWRREQKEAMEKGLITMEDVEMAVADGTALNANKHPVRAKQNPKNQAAETSGGCHGRVKGKSTMWTLL